jgi:putative transposase
MMWMEEHRRIYRREGEGYPSDLRDAGWARLAPLIPEASPGGRPRKTDMRAAMNAFRICCALAAPGAICPATAFRPLNPTLGAFVALASIQLALRRLARM